MLSNIGIGLVYSILALSFLTIYNAHLDLKIINTTVKKIIYKLSLFQITFTILSFFTFFVLLMLSLVCESLS